MWACGFKKVCLKNQNIKKYAIKTKNYSLIIINYCSNNSVPSPFFGCFYCNESCIKFLINLNDSLLKTLILKSTQTYCINFLLKIAMSLLYYGLFSALFTRLLFTCAQPCTYSSQSLFSSSPPEKEVVRLDIKVLKPLTIQLLARSRILSSSVHTMCSTPRKEEAKSTEKGERRGEKNK